MPEENSSISYIRCNGKQSSPLDINMGSSSSLQIEKNTKIPENEISHLDMDLNRKNNFSIQLSSTIPLKISSIQKSDAPITRASDYNQLNNKPAINNVALIGNKSSAELGIVSENTLEGWEDQWNYVPKLGEICLYTDLGKIKIGDGSVPIIDLPFFIDIDYAYFKDQITNHIEDTSRHVTDEERTFWNQKLNYDISGEALILTQN